MKRWKCLCALCCSDSKLTTFLATLDRGDARPHYVKRDLGLPFVWNNAGQSNTLERWYEEATGFEGIPAPITGGLVLSHTNCVAVATNKFFGHARQRRKEFPETPAGELAFCLEELELIRTQTAYLSPLPPSFQSKRTTFGWYYGVVDTHRAEQLNQESTLREAANCITWLDGIPDFFEKRLVLEDPVVSGNGHGASTSHPGTIHDSNHTIHQTSHGSVITS